MTTTQNPAGTLRPDPDQQAEFRRDQERVRRAREDERRAAERERLARREANPNSPAVHHRRAARSWGGSASLDDVEFRTLFAVAKYADRVNPPRSFEELIAAVDRDRGELFRHRGLPASDDAVAEILHHLIEAGALHERTDRYSAGVTNRVDTIYEVVPVRVAVARRDEEGEPQ